MRKPAQLFKDVYDVRAKYGKTEYGRPEILPAVMDLMTKHGISQEAMHRDAASKLLDEIEHREDRDADLGPGLFPYDAQVALGKGKRIRRGYMNDEHLRRREGLIDHNKMVQDQSWAKEKRWVKERRDALAGHPSTTLVRDVLPERVAEEALA